MGNVEGFDSRRFGLAGKEFGASLRKGTVQHNEARPIESKRVGERTAKVGSYNKRVNG